MDNLDTSTLIQLDGLSLLAAVCSMCGCKHYPPEGVQACMDRHALLANHVGLQLLVGELFAEAGDRGHRRE